MVVDLNQQWSKVWMRIGNKIYVVSQLVYLLT